MNMKQPIQKLKILYLASGYLLPAGIEAYLLHYATEVRQFGCEAKIIVFKPLPKVPHRYLQALYDRDIPIESLDSQVMLWAKLLTALSWLPWFLSMKLRGKSIAGGALYYWWLARLSVVRLKRVIQKDNPDVVHIQGRLPHLAWNAIPTHNCIYHHQMQGTVDSAWLPYEVDAFRTFVEQIPYIFVPGANVGRTFRRCFQIQHETTEVFTIAPDEAGGKAEIGKQKAEIRVGSAGLNHEDTKTRRETEDGRLKTEDGRQRTEVGCLRSDPCNLPPSTKDYGPRTTDQGPISKSLQSSVFSLQSGSELRFGILCRFVNQKGIVYILEALKSLKPTYGDLNFTFAGQGPLEEEILRYADDNGLAGVCVIPVPSPAAVLRDMDVFVHPGVDDAMPVSIVEALMFGLPCVVSDVGGCPDLVREGIEGFVIPAADASAIAGAMRMFLDMEPAAFSAMQRSARERYETCCRPEVVMQQVVGIYREIVGSKRI